jgi:hypothetical protein
MKFGTVRVSGSAFTCDPSDADLEVLPLGFVGLVRPLRFGEAGVGARLSVDIVVPVLEWRFAGCSSLELKVDLVGEFWGKGSLFFDAGPALGLERRSRDEGREASVDGFA